MGSTDPKGHVAIIGASHAGLQAAQALRAGGWEGPISLYSAEDCLPYQRPDLSKGFLLEDRPDPMPLKAEAFFETSDIALHLATPVTAIDRTAKTLTAGGETRAYDRLIIATGARTRKLGYGAENMATLRDIADARAIRAALRPGNHIAVIGGGFIGLEVAAAAREHGATVTVIEASPRCLARALPARMTEAVLDRHRAAGVDLRIGCGVAAPELSAGRITALELTDGTRLPCDMVVAGIGCDANIEIARDAGLRIEAGGIAVDGRLRTSDPAIQAIGDCASFASSLVPGPLRIESIQNATDQARHAAAVLLGAEEDFLAVPWFWSHQYEMKIQMAGFPQPDADLLLRGDPASGSFSLLQLDAEGRLLAAYSLNSVTDHVAARKLIGTDVALDPVRAADPAVRLRDALRTPAQQTA